MAKFKIGDKVRSKDYPDAGVMTITQIGQDVHGTTYRTKWENGSVPSQVFYDSTLVAANVLNETRTVGAGGELVRLASMNPVVANELTWMDARSGKVATNKSWDFKVGDKVRFEGHPFSNPYIVTAVRGEEVQLDYGGWYRRTMFIAKNAAVTASAVRSVNVDLSHYDLSVTGDRVQRGMERLGWNPRIVEKTNRRVLWDLHGANPSVVEKWISGALSTSEASEGVALKAKLFGDTTRVSLTNSCTCTSTNAVVANALAWRARNARDADGKELKIGDKIKVQTDMHGRWDGGGVVTALKPYGIVDYKDVFGNINTTHEHSVRVVNAVATNAFYKTKAEAEYRSGVFVDAAENRIKGCIDDEIKTVNDCIKLFKGAPMSDKAKENLERLNAHLQKLKRCKAMF